MKKWSFLILCILVALMCSAALADDSGTCGNGVNWSLTGTTLTISGSGKMDDYNDTRPWPNTIRELIVQGNVTHIGNKAFYKYPYLTAVTITAPVESIGREAFYYCEDLVSVTLPNALKSIGYRAFYYNTSLREVTIPSKTEQIGSEAFRACSSLQEVSFTAKNTVIGQNAFANLKTTNFKTVRASSLEVWLSLEFDSIGANPLGSGVTLLINGQSPVNITVPSTVKKINKDAFNYCGSLETVVVSSGVTEIGSGAFYYCQNLRSVTLPDSVTKLGSSAFKSCSSLETVKLGNGITEINDETFAFCGSLTSVTLPSKTTRIGEDAFYSCGNLTSITITNSLSKVEDEAFRDCDALKDVNFTGSWDDRNAITVEGNKNYQFGLATWHYSPTLTISYIYQNGSKAADPYSKAILQGTDYHVASPAIKGYKPDQETVSGTMKDQHLDVTVTYSVTDPGTDPGDSGDKTKTGSQTDSSGNTYHLMSDGTAVFKQAKKNATTVTVPAEITVKGKKVKVTEIAAKAFYKNTKLTKVTIGKNVKTIGKSAFEGCAKLKTLKLSSALETIGDKAFKGCKALTTLTLGKKVKKIGKSAFEGCSKLKAITIKTTKLTAKTIGKNCFKKIASNAQFKCPKARLENYKKWLKKPGGAPARAKYKK